MSYCLCVVYRRHATSTGLPVALRHLESSLSNCCRVKTSLGSLSGTMESTTRRLVFVSLLLCSSFTCGLPLQSNKSHQVNQFHITNWAPDGHCSNIKSVTDVIEEVGKVQRRTGNHPIVVHCRYANSSFLLQRKQALACQQYLFSPALLCCCLCVCCVCLCVCVSAVTR